jgi:lipopolysaccharide transport system ATP-binding protein
MFNTAIKVEGLSKSYFISHAGRKRYTTLRDVLAQKTKQMLKGIARPFSSSKAADAGRREEFWALKDISFEVRQGERIGIIGRNGAGKSTLLKVLSRITAPTKGHIKIHGRVGSLLEVGTGFHPELTGRENIFLNGAIIGMRNAEIRKKFDDIVAFGEVEQFLDTPVKHYSSGMFVRLAFAVAAHLEPEILIVDEVLAVGDAQFQKKCLGKMGEVSRNEGRTVLFVSHNMEAVKKLCTDCIVLDSGVISYKGETAAAVREYLQKGSITATSNDWADGAGPGNENIRLIKVSAKPVKGELIDTDSGISVAIEFYNFKVHCNIDITFELSNIEGTIIFHTGTFVAENNSSKKGKYSVCAEIQPFLLNAGRYSLKLIFGENQRYPLFIISNILYFDVVNCAESQGTNYGILPGIIKPKLNYQVAFMGE